MKVTLETKTDANALGVRVICDERWTTIEHFNAGIATLVTARNWFVKQQCKVSKK